MSLPELWTLEKGAAEAKKNNIIFVYGTTKTGKTELCVSTNRPLYYAHFDPHDNLNDHLVNRIERGFTSAAYPKWYYPVPYAVLTQEEAERRVRDLMQFAADARAACAKGAEGVFVIDGAKWLKGYIEKWILGESATLGYRAKQGERGVTSIEYAASNAVFADIVNAFVGSNCHLIVTFEGREKWVEYTDDRGKKNRKPSGRFEAKIPGDVAFSMSAMVETLVEAVEVGVVDYKKVYDFQHKIRFELIGAVGMGHLRNRVMPAKGFDEVLDLLQANIPAESVLEPKHEIRRMDMDDEVLPTMIEESDAAP